MAKQVTLILTGALAGAIVGAVGSRMFPERPSEYGMSERNTSEDSALQEVARRLDGLEAELRAMRALVELGTAPPSELTRTPLPTAEQSSAEPNAARLDAILERLQGLDDAIGSLAAHFDAIVRATAEAGVRPEVLPEVLPETPANVPLLYSLRGRSLEELSDQHLLWTYEKVGATYGRPTRVAPSPGGEGVKYYYEMPDGSAVIFWFIGGKVIRVFGDE